MINNQVSIDLYRIISKSNEARLMEQWHCSSIAQCPKAQYMARLGVERLSKPTASKVLRWKAGHLIEEAIRPFIDEVYSGVESNVRLESKKLDMTGEFDNYSPSQKRVIEVKSVDDMAFKDDGGLLGLKNQIGFWPNGNKKWGIKETPYLSHEWQNHGYHLLGKENGYEIKGVDYVYISLRGRIVVYSTDITSDSSITKDVKERITLLNKAWKTKTPPPCICTKDGQPNVDNPMWHTALRYCDYQTTTGCCELNLAA